MQKSTIGIWEQAGTYIFDFHDLKDERTYQLHHDMRQAFGLRDKLLGEPNYERWDSEQDTLYTTSLELAEALLGKLSSKDFARMMNTYTDTSPGSQEERILPYLATLDHKFLYYGFVGQMFRVSTGNREIRIDEIGWCISSKNPDLITERVPFWLQSKSEESKKLEKKVLLCTRVLPIEEKGFSLRDRVVRKWNHPLVLVARKKIGHYALANPYHTTLAEASQFGIPSWFINEEGKEVKLDRVMSSLK
ncbi:hypothetical protein HYT57_01200 [Candidatus Woesearchaeota archaeon]|nr:hypothetical protein [Candidatus Woesearchaeota archaeon]